MRRFADAIVSAGPDRNLMTPTRNYENYETILSIGCRDISWRQTWSAMMEHHDALRRDSLVLSAGDASASMFVVACFNGAALMQRFQVLARAHVLMLPVDGTG
jgi:hypothetical protein